METQQFFSKDFLSFQRWINLNLEAVTWQGKFAPAFEDFWTTFFLEGATLGQINERFLYAKEHVKVGPLATWFKWLRRKFILFVFFKREVSITSIAEEVGISESEVALMLRDFLIHKYPQAEELINEKVCVGDITSTTIRDKHGDVLEKIKLPLPEDGDEDDVLASLEVTLYEEWQQFLKHMKKDLLREGFDLSKLRERASMQNQKKFFKEVSLYFVLGGVIVFGVNKFNEWYELELAKKIEIFELDFKWLDSSLRFKPETEEEVREEDFIVENIDDLERAEAQTDTFEFAEEERFGGESDVILTSLEAIPRNITTARLEQSKYEERKKISYRDTRLGNKKVYRLLMKSVDPEGARSKLNPLMEKFQVKPIGNVAPGTPVPGGIYYNLHVPIDYLREFLGSVLEVEEGVLYENRSRGRNPPGMSRVFVWIKRI